MVSPRNGQPLFPGGRLNLASFLCMRMKIRIRDTTEGRRRRISSESNMEPA
uniref:Uncharacterized protein n=1 Tax=Rhizophora mucronata TaxID=61149 RepID=A0A2P2NYH3_RHIMU